MTEGTTLERFRLRIVGVADIDPEALGVRRARALGIPEITTRYQDLYRIPGLDLIIELTGREEVRDEIERTRPRDVRLIDHFAARLFWGLHQAEEAVVGQRVEMRQRVEAERERIAQIMDSIPDEILVIDADMKIEYASSSFLRNNGLSIEAVRGLHCYEVDQHVRGECRVAVGNCPFSQVLEQGEPVFLVRKHAGPDGQPLYAAIVGAPLRDRDGQVVGMIEMTRDITHRIRLEEELTAREVHLRQFLDQAPLAAYVKNRAGQYIDVNPAATALFGKSAADLVGRTDAEVFPQEAAEALVAEDRRVWESRLPASVETEVDLGDHRVLLSTTKFPLLDADGQPTALCALSDDVTAQKEAETQLTETREYLQNILDTSPVIIITTDVDGAIVSFNRGAELSLGYSAAEVVGRPASVFYEDPDQRETLLRRIAADGAVQDFHCELLRKDGSNLSVSLTLSQLRDSEGNVLGTVGISKDISHRQALMRQILQSERRAAVGRLAAGVAHEINNPLAVIAEIAGFLDDLARDEDEAPELAAEVRRGLPKILRHVERGREITRRLLSFARKTEARIEVADVNASLDEILPFLEKEATLARATIHRDYEPDLPRVAVEEMQLQEVFINLITNAIQAVATCEQGSVSVSTESAGEKVRVTVRDDGPGISPSVRDRLFDPFVTTKPSGQGTGLGLSICYGIVRRFDGQIRVTSEPGQGAAFEVILPALRPGQREG